MYLRKNIGLLVEQAYKSQHSTVKKVTDFLETVTVKKYNVMKEYINKYLLKHYYYYYFYYYWLISNEQYHTNDNCTQKERTR